MFHCNLFFRLSALIRIKINDEQGQAIPIKPVDDKGKLILSTPSLILPYFKDKKIMRHNTNSHKLLSTKRNVCLLRQTVLSVFSFFPLKKNYAVLLACLCPNCNPSAYGLGLASRHIKARRTA